MMMQAERTRALTCGAAGVAMSVALTLAAPLAALAQEAPARAPGTETAPAPHERPPTPLADFVVRGKVRPQGEASFAYSKGRLRVEIMDGPTTVMIGLIDPEARKITVLPSLAGIEGLAIEMELPPEFSLVAMPENSRRIGFDTVATEPCEVWQGTPPGSTIPVESCITMDGIPLRTHATTRNGAEVSFEATELGRLPQDPEVFELPPGTKVRKLPRSLQNMVPGGLAP